MFSRSSSYRDTNRNQFGSTLTSAGKSVTVSYNNSSYSITSSTKGSTSAISINSIGSNLDSFLKLSGTTDNDNIGSSQSGTADTAMTLNGSSVTGTDTDGLVDNETLGSSGNFSIDGACLVELVHQVHLF